MALSQRTDVDGRAIRIWLYCLAAMVFAMVVVGGATRLTDSGLSITEWKPILGIIPPLSSADWLDAFARYKLIPEYQLVNRGMTLTEFKFIFWWEWAHRFLGRMIGFAFAIPFVVFVWRGMISRRLLPKVLGLFVLGGLQGFVGWYMVRSGLAERVDVSQYRLALHLSLAVLVFGLMLWTAFRLAPDKSEQPHLATVTAMQRWGAGLLVALVFLQIVLGAFVAGLKAGLAYNSWPLMDGQLIPDGLWLQSPWYLNLFENALTVQFDHRMLAYVIVLLAASHVLAVVRTADDERMRRSSWFVMGAVLAQVVLGIVTLVMHVPLALGLLHQGAAVILFGACIWHARNIFCAERA